MIFLPLFSLICHNSLLLSSLLPYSSQFSLLHTNKTSNVPLCRACCTFFTEFSRVSSIQRTLALSADALSVSRTHCIAAGSSAGIYTFRTLASIACISCVTVAFPAIANTLPGTEQTSFSFTGVVVALAVLPVDLLVRFQTIIAFTFATFAYTLT